METLEQNSLISQDDALKNYLDSLLCGEKETDLPIVELDEAAPPLFQPKDLFDAMLMESNHASEQIKRPVWGAEFFSCLPIEVGSVTLLIPLRQVRTVVPVRHKITPVEHLPDWIKGTMANFSQKLTVVDLYKMVYQQADCSLQNNATQLVLLGSGKTGLSCHQVGKVRQLREEDITWRAKKSKRRWIAGVSLKHQLVIVDTRRIEFAMAMESRLV